MSSAEYLREIVNERLTAAAEEIFGVFKTAIVQYEQEIDRQRKLLDIVWKPEIKLHRIEIPQQHVCKEEEVHAEQQLSNKDCNSSVIQKEPEPPQIKEEQEELFTSEEVEQHETHSFLLTPTHEESDDCDIEPESNNKPLSYSTHVTETQDQIAGKHGGSGSTRDAGSKSKQREIDTNGVKDFKWSRISCNSHTGEKLFKCETCGKTFKQKTPLRRHLRVHTEIPQQHECKEEEVHAEQQLSNKDCNSSVIQKDPEPPQIKEEQNGPFTSQEGEQVSLNLETHSFLLTPTHEEIDDCDIEPESNNKPLSHSTHVAETQDQIGGKHQISGLKRDAESKSKQREIDNNKVKNPEQFKISRKTCIDERPFKCETCGKAFKQNIILQRHLRVHTGEKPYSCDTCGKRYSCASFLKEHMTIHTGEKPYTCETCGKHYRFGSAFRLHLKKHTGERSHTCDTCKKAFYTKSQLRLHMRTHTGERPYPCNMCGKDFISKNELSSHMRTHTGERPYLCRVCGRRFISRQIVKRHFRTHTGEKPFTCTTCGKPFRIHYNLQRHMRTHTGEKPHSCEICGKRFIEKSKLKKHLGMHTREKSHQQKKESGKRFD